LLSRWRSQQFRLVLTEILLAVLDALRALMRWMEKNSIHQGSHQSSWTHIFHTLSYGIRKPPKWCWWYWIDDSLMHPSRMLEHNSVFRVWMLVNNLCFIQRWEREKWCERFYKNEKVINKSVRKIQKNVKHWKEWKRCLSDLFWVLKGQRMK
jgi:hypothetical protein